MRRVSWTPPVRRSTSASGSPRRCQPAAFRVRSPTTQADDGYVARHWYRAAPAPATLWCASAGLGRDEQESAPSGYDRPGAGVLVEGAKAVPVLTEAVPRD